MEAELQEGIPQRSYGTRRNLIGELLTVQAGRLNGLGYKQCPQGHCV
jgi:hypothetical protein